MRQPHLPGFEPPRAGPGRDGPPCLKCGADTVVSPGTPPHHLRADCPDCRAWRWLPKGPASRGETLDHDTKTCSDLTSAPAKGGGPGRRIPGLGGSRVSSSERGATKP